MADWIDRFSLAGRKAMVTGASTGIGAKICEVFADAGADIVAVARNKDGLEETAASVDGYGRRCLTLAADLGSADETRAVGQQALDGWGTIDILVNNAATARLAPALDLTLEAWDQSMAVNVRAPFLLSQILAPGMIAQRWGKIVNVSSQTGLIGSDEHAAYAASKAAMNGLTKSLIAEWAQHNIQVNAICPTVVMTQMGEKVWGPAEKGGPMLARIPLGRFGKPVEIADLALYLASPAAEMINGELIMIEGGYTSV
jgi:NAD(P)-dependent dehydrogenase (short-subunit alcohol dehydrogenase family)